MNIIAQTNQMNSFDAAIFDSHKEAEHCCCNKPPVRPSRQPSSHTPNSTRQKRRSILSSTRLSSLLSEFPSDDFTMATSHYGSFNEGGHESVLHGCSNEFPEPPKALTKDKIRAFMYDYYADYDSMKGKQKYHAWRCFAERYYCPTKFQFIRPCGNHHDFNEWVKGAFDHLVIRSMKLVSIDTITILPSNETAIVVLTNDYKFDFKGSPLERRGVATCILEPHPITGAIQIVHEHRSGMRPIPKETRWQASEKLNNTCQGSIQ